MSFEGLSLDWYQQLRPGYPGPIVSGDRVFLAETVDEETEVVRALDRTTGRKLWRKSLPGEGSAPVPPRKMATGSAQRQRAAAKRSLSEA